jgi:hypothetical protein
MCNHNGGDDFLKTAKKTTDKGRWVVSKFSTVPTIPLPHSHLLSPPPPPFPHTHNCLFKMTVAASFSPFASQALLEMMIRIIF